ncbi:integral membrane protein [Apiospora arundinis]|uniref:Integral membrane protein n=1 Tax=Apiospora arundinis TaxID=335852 RepID=A0ABR2IGT1_9PEZI
MSTSPPKGTPEYAEWAAQDKGPTVLVACWTVTAISTVFVAGRLYVRGVLQRKLRSDDYLIILSLLCGFISTAFSTVATSYGNGKHFELLNLEQKQGAILWTTAAFCPGILSFGLPKLAVIALLTRILNPSRAHLWFLWTMGIVCTASLLATVGVLLGQCTPARSLWTFSITEKTCFDKKILIDYCVYAGSISAFVDLYLAIYPSLVLLKLQMPIKKKLALCAALGIGSVSGIVAIYKSTRIPSLGSPDFSHDTSDLVIWTVIEGSTIIIASSIPVMQPLAEVLFGRSIFGSSGSKGRRYYDGDQNGGTNDSSQPGLVTIGQKSSRPKKQLNDDLEMTISGTNFSSSEEDILNPRHIGSTDSPTAVAVVDNEVPKFNDAVVKTQTVSVTYGESEAANRNMSTTASERWKPV